MQFPKGVREALCAAQSALYDRANSAGTGVDVSRILEWTAELQYMIDQIDQVRPLGSNGKHGDWHTGRCGCGNNVQSWVIRFNPVVGHYADLCDYINQKSGWHCTHPKMMGSRLCTYHGSVSSVRFDPKYR